ncbi:hypothetical protein M409DRAFT_17781 [Zasmidium cellare ATCC 36951]|uniref:NDT80 domain-containing protein n=1 Tax=Zasmidium cellare ATCC 36951 TaxID=1080233 RepID=A0A6A6D2D3_ZASCE|nr:uncharacterized protein M409DRAFT_17781 [Zasmidium cellare ATCC 36951]KAF2172550.1 hypothetical protein M409DRAFT_17781 [Zasmidium cellare ATCC 36951]
MFMQDAPLARIDETDQALFFTATKTTPSDRALAPHLAVITAQLSGTFLRGPHPGIVCYRRNFFHVRGNIVFQSATKSLLAATPRGDSRHIHISASLSAVESTNGDQVAIIALRRGAQEASPSLDTQIVAPIDMDVEPSSGLSTPISFSWSRLQFRAATAKGGRRKEKAPEQSFRLQLHVSAWIGDASEVLLAETCSAPIIVRGRSPGNYTSTSKISKDNAGPVAPCESSSQHATSEQPQIARESAARAMSISNLEIDAAGEQPPASTSYEDFLDLGTLESLIEPAGAPPDLSAVQLGHDDRSPGLLSSLNLTNAEYLEWVDSGDFISPTFTPQDFLPSTDSNAELLSTISFHPADFTDARTDHQHDDLFPDDTSEESYSYTYIPLAMDDRTPPVQAVYVGAQLVFYEADTDCHPATAWGTP